MAISLIAEMIYRRGEELRSVREKRFFLTLRLVEGFASITLALLGLYVMKSGSNLISLKMSRAFIIIFIPTVGISEIIRKMLKKPTQVILPVVLPPDHLPEVMAALPAPAALIPRRVEVAPGQNIGRVPIATPAPIIVVPRAVEGPPLAYLAARNEEPPISYEEDQRAVRLQTESNKDAQRAIVSRIRDAAVRNSDQELTHYVNQFFNMQFPGLLAKYEVDIQHGLFQIYFNSDYFGKYMLCEIGRSFAYTYLTEENYEIQKRFMTTLYYLREQVGVDNIPYWLSSRQLEEFRRLRMPEAFIQASSSTLCGYKFLKRGCKIPGIISGYNIDYE